MTSVSSIETGQLTHQYSSQTLDTQLFLHLKEITRYLLHSGRPNRLWFPF